MLPTPFSRLAPPTNTKLVEFRIMGCYNGLLCLLEQPARRIHLWNPSTRICKKLPEIPDCGGIHTLGFGWVESSDEYKVFLVHNDGTYKVYSSKAKSWKTIGLRTDLLRVWGTGVFAGGKLHWSHFRPCEQYILFFDFKSEVFGSIDLPFAPDIRDKFGLVCVLGGSLCVLRRHDDYERGLAHVWVMKEESWEKAVALDHLLELLQSPSPLVVGLNGEVLLSIGSHLLVYDARDNVFHVLKYTSYCHVYVESLVSPEDL
ncbi:F-box/kelch-repeat protein At3g23880-like [Salvia miltiorrhiza]|uniref:F-box/kelch-repeat protein At3g23880-like n=1 Tax=Salvia miltiorrhiza TaxID=226208 RepID=UPI0025ABB27F|nr:F-box/kelch-repeat protein At3g23880-like [Salvia miltiorrhiza]